MDSPFLVSFVFSLTQIEKERGSFPLSFSHKLFINSLLLMLCLKHLPLSQMSLHPEHPYPMSRDAWFHLPMLPVLLRETTLLLRKGRDACCRSPFKCSYYVPFLFVRYLLLYPDGFLHLFPEAGCQVSLCQFCCSACLFCDPIVPGLHDLLEGVPDQTAVSAVGYTALGIGFSQI